MNNGKPQIKYLRSVLNEAVLFGGGRPVKQIVCCLLLLCSGCADRPDVPGLHLTVTGGRSVQIKGLNRAVMGEINRNPAPGSWQALLPVYRMPADTGLADYQPVQPGVYLLKDSAIVFTPDTPFIKGQAYFVRYSLFGANDNAWAFVKGKKKPGARQHIDLKFKY